MVDYRRFLAATTSADLPYFGGPFVDATDRRLRVAGPAGPAGSPVTPGFWRFEVRGRDAHPVAPADPPDLSALPAVRGYAVAAYLVHEVRPVVENGAGRHRADLGTSRAARSRTSSAPARPQMASTSSST